ncbi:MAG: hypothetical protein ACKO22_05145 [Cyanobium sp.]
MSFLEPGALLQHGRQTLPQHGWMQPQAGPIVEDQLQMMQQGFTPQQIQRPPQPAAQGDVPQVQALAGLQAETVVLAMNGVRGLAHAHHLTEIAHHAAAQHLVTQERPHNQRILTIRFSQYIQTVAVQQVLARLNLKAVISDLSVIHLAGIFQGFRQCGPQPI